MDRTGSPGGTGLYDRLARRVYGDLVRQEYALPGAYLPEEVLHTVARMTVRPELVPSGEASPEGAAPLLMRALDRVRSPARPNRRWCVLVRNVVHMLALSGLSLCTSDLSGLDLTECDLGAVRLSAGGRSACLDNSLVRFDSFVRYRVPGLSAEEEPLFALDVAPTGRVLLACGSVLMRVLPAAPLASRVVCDLREVLGEGWTICKLRFSRDVRCVMLSVCRDVAAFDAATSLRGGAAEEPCRRFLFDGANLIECHDLRERGPGAVLRPNGAGVSAWLGNRELARFHERHCWELETGDPIRDELSARDRVFSGDLRYKLENGRLTERETRRALAHIYAEPGPPAAPGAALCRLNKGAAGCDFSRLHPESPITAQEIALLTGRKA